MKQYVYTADEMQLGRSFSDGTLRLNCEVTNNPYEADVFVCPEPLFKFTDPHELPRRMHWINDPEKERRHVFLDLSEHFTVYDQRNPMFIRAALNKKMLDYGPNSISWPWPVDDYAECVWPSMVGEFSKHFAFGVSFHAWLSNLARKITAKAINEKTDVLKPSIATYTQFFGYLDDETKKNRQMAYRSSMRNSLCCITVESIPGVIPYRFYEAMSAGRTQLYIGQDYNLPFEREIPYDNFVTKLPADRADEAGEFALDWITRHSEETLMRKGREARDYWERFLWRDNWVNLMTYAVAAKLRSMGIAV